MAPTWCLEYKLVGAVPFAAERHNAENIYSRTPECRTAVGMKDPLTEVHCFVSDQGSNVRKAWDQRSPCAGHLVPLPSGGAPPPVPACPMGTTLLPAGGRNTSAQPT